MLAPAEVPPFTVTIGLAIAEPGEAFSAAVDRADSAMRKAKELGRDRVLAVGDSNATAADTLPHANGSGPDRGQAPVPISQEP